MPGMTDRDHFAAAALTGFASQLRCGSVFNLTLTAKQCYELADAMLRERAKTNHDAAPAARASVESVAPQPTARGESDRTDKAAPRPSEGTGDTPKPIKGGVSDRSKPIASEQEPVAWGVADGKGLLATSIHRIDAVDMQSDYAYHTEIVPLYRSPPVTEPMPKEKRAEVCAGPLAWAAIRENGQPLWLSYDRSGAEGMVNGMAEVVPLYRNPTLTDAEREAIYRASQYLSQNDVFEGMAEDAAALRGLLERLR